MQPIEKEVQSYLPTVFSALLLVVLVLQNTKLPITVAYAITAAVYASIPVLILSGHNFIFSIKKAYFVLFFVFSLIVFIRTALDPAMGDVLRLLTLLSFTLANFLIIPRIVSLQTFLRTLSRISAVLILIGLLPLLGFPSQIGIIDLSFWGTFSEYNVTIITSVFVNPNQLGALALIGALAALAERQTLPVAVADLLFGINVVGLFLSHYRTGWIALTATMGLFILYSVWGHQSVVVATISGIFTIAVGLLMAFSIIPGPAALSKISLNGRRELWTVSVRALQEQVLIGHGFAGTQELVGNPHNSYLRMFTSFGIFGGIIYTILVIGAAVGSTRQARTYRGLVLTVIIISIFIIQIFNHLSFVGISMRSSLIAIFMGYYMRSTIDGVTGTQDENDYESRHEKTST